MLDQLYRFSMHVPTEPGYPCGHRRLLKYCLDPAVTSWEKLYDMHFVKFEEDNFAVRKMGKSSFFKCMTAYHPEFRLKRVMEDACDTCIVQLPVKYVMYSFPWRRNSCAIDSLGSCLQMSYNNLTKDGKEMMEQYCPDLCQLFANLSNGIIPSRA